MKNYPKVNQSYSIDEVFQLDLRDAPFLMILHQDDWYPIQTSHLLNEQVIEELQGTKWEYKFETSEWIPIFHLDLFSKVKPDVVISWDDYIEETLVYLSKLPRE